MSNYTVKVTTIRLVGRQPADFRAGTQAQISGEIDVIITSPQGAVQLTIPFDRCPDLDTAAARALKQVQEFCKEVGIAAAQALAESGWSP